MAVLTFAVSSNFHPANCSIPSVLWVSLTRHRAAQRALHPFWGPYLPVQLHLLVCYTPVVATPVEQGSGLRLRFAPGSCISITDGDFGLRILPFFVEGGSQLYPRKSIESSPKITKFPNFHRGTPRWAAFWCLPGAAEKTDVFTGKPGERREAA